MVAFTDRLFYSGMQNGIVTVLMASEKIDKNIGGRLALLTSI